MEDRAVLNLKMKSLSHLLIISCIHKHKQLHQIKPTFT